MTDNNSNKPRHIKPPNYLKQQVGSGGIPEETLQKAQKFINSVQIDFLSFASPFISTINSEIGSLAQAEDTDIEEKKEDLASAFMQLKANGGMFGYPLVGEVSRIALHLIDNCHQINHEDTIDVLKAQEKALNLILSLDMRDYGGEHGDELVNELQKMSDRYFLKHVPPKTKVPDPKA